MCINQLQLSRIRTIEKIFNKIQKILKLLLTFAVSHCKIIKQSAVTTDWEKTNRGLVKWYDRGLQNLWWEFDSLIPCSVRGLKLV